MNHRGPAYSPNGGLKPETACHALQRRSPFSPWQSLAMRVLAVMLLAFGYWESPMVAAGDVIVEVVRAKDRTAAAGDGE